MKAITAASMKEIDRKAQEIYGIQSIILMENAGIAVANLAKKVLRKKPKIIAVFCGKGNNGGDGYVAARHLFNNGFDVKVFVISNYSSIKGDSKINLEIILKMGIEVYELSDSLNKIYVKKILDNSFLIIDAIFGIGFKGTVPDHIADIIDIMNSSKKPILAVDVPSGLEADTGKKTNICVNATKTLTFTLPKKGFYKNDGPYFTGNISVSDIGIPKALLV